MPIACRTQLVNSDATFRAQRTVAPPLCGTAACTDEDGKGPRGLSTASAGPPAIHEQSFACLLAPPCLCVQGSTCVGRCIGASLRPCHGAQSGIPGLRQGCSLIRGGVASYPGQVGPAAQAERGDVISAPDLVQRFQHLLGNADRSRSSQEPRTASHRWHSTGRRAVCSAGGWRCPWAAVWCERLHGSTAEA